MMNEQVEIQKLLMSTLQDARKRNPSYSVRALSQKIQISSSALSEILNGKRRISGKIAARITERLCLEPEEQKRIQDLFINNRSNQKKTNSNRDYMQLNMDHYHVVSDWYYFAILSLAETDDFTGEPEWISKRLNITLRQAKTALDRLQRLEMLVKDETTGKLKPTGVQFATSDDIANKAIRSSHHQNLDLAKTSLDRDDIHTRDFTAMTMAIDPDLLPEAKRRIRAFQDDLCGFLESGRKKEVYRLCMQLFTLTHKEKKQ